MKEKYILCSIDQYESVYQAVSHFAGFDVPKIEQTLNDMYLVPISIELQIKIPELLDGLDGFEIIDEIW